MSPEIKGELLEGRFAKVLAEFRRRRARNPDLRPFAVEFFGTPKSGKTTMGKTAQHFLKRNGCLVSAPPEGAEVVETPRTTPHYNLETCRYALSQLHQRQTGPFEVVLLDRGLYDGIMWLDYWRKKGHLKAEEQSVIEDYYRLPLLRGLFDLHLCLVCEPETALAREIAQTISKKDGETMNPDSLRKLLDSHRAAWDRFDCGGDSKMFWRDTTADSPVDSALAVLEAMVVAFERRLQTS